MKNIEFTSTLIFVLLWSVLLLQVHVITARLNKPIAATIKTIYGDTYNCVNFYDQPAFDHPLLKNYKFEYQMKPSTQGLEVSATNSSSFSDELPNIWVNGKGCPIGTVPIRKTTKSISLKPNLTAFAASDLNPGVHVAVLRSTGNKKYRGAGMKTSVYNHIVDKNQYTSSRMKFANDPDSIAVGWTVNPSLYQDAQTRLFIYTITKDLQCYNTFCPGFVLTSHNIPLDVVLKPISKRGGPTYLQRFLITKNPATGDWILLFGFKNRVLGYWPKRIFTELVDFGNYAEWGGEVYSPPNLAIPPMGSGCRPVGNTKLDGYASAIMIIDEDDRADNNPRDCETYADISKYRVIDQGYVGGDLQRLVEFGGNSLLFDPSFESC